MVNKRRKRWSTPLVFKEMESKTTMRYHFIFTRFTIVQKQKITVTDEAAEKLGLSYIAGGNVK